MSIAWLQGGEGCYIFDALSTRLRFWVNEDGEDFFQDWHIIHSSCKSYGERLQLADGAECTPFLRIDSGNSSPPQAHMAPTSHSIITGIPGFRGMIWSWMHWHDWKHIHAWVNFKMGRKGCGFIERNNGEGGVTHTHMHVQQTSAQLCYWRCKNQCSTGKAFPLLELGVRLPSVAFNYSLSLRPEESNWFSFRTPKGADKQKDLIWVYGEM